MQFQGITKRKLNKLRENIKGRCYLKEKVTGILFVDILESAVKTKNVLEIYDETYSKRLLCNVAEDAQSPEDKFRNGSESALLKHNSVVYDFIGREYLYCEPLDVNITVIMAENIE